MRGDRADASMANASLESPKPLSLLRRLFPGRDQRARYLPLYNAIVAEARDPDTPIILARAVGRPDERIRILPLGEVEASLADMSTVVIIGASTTRRIEKSDGDTPYVYTPRYYGVRA